MQLKGGIMKDEVVFNSINAGNSKTFDVEVKEVYDGKHYKGKFEIKYSNVKDTINIKLEEAKLKGDVSEGSLDNFARFLIEGLATLKVLSVNKPDWAANIDTLPTQLVVDVYTNYVEQVQFFRNGGHQKDTTNSSVAGSETPVTNG